jgi:hypothetical protein
MALGARWNGGEATTHRLCLISLTLVLSATTSRTLQGNGRTTAAAAREEEFAVAYDARHGGKDTASTVLFGDDAHAVDLVSHCTLGITKRREESV